MRLDIGAATEELDLQALFGVVALCVGSEVARELGLRLPLELQLDLRDLALWRAAR